MTPRHFATVLAVLVGLAAALTLWHLPGVHESWVRSPVGNQAHALEYLPKASMLQAADSCGDGHFHREERYGYWVQDFQLLVGGPAPDSAARALLTHPEPLAQLYALAALALVDSAGFQAALSTYLPPDTAVAVAEGCQVRERPVRELVREVGTGYWPRELTKRRIDVH